MPPLILGHALSPNALPCSTIPPQPTHKKRAETIVKRHISKTADQARHEPPFIGRLLDFQTLQAPIK